MENKYYVPKISEFHVGFEYEEYQFLTRDWKSVKCEFIKTSEIDPKWFRVKYLDQSDIESLDWKLTKDFVGEIVFQKHIDNTSWWELDYELDTKLLEIEYCKLNHNNLTDLYTKFSGTIKNKSQLKFIMTCLGILE